MTEPPSTAATTLPEPAPGRSMITSGGSAMAPASPGTVDWFAGLFEPLAGLAIERGIKLPTLIDSLKLALVRAATAVTAAEATTSGQATSGATTSGAAPGPRQGDPHSGAAQPARSDSRLAVMTGVHRKDLRRIRTTGSTARPKGRSVAGEVFARWQSDPRFLTTRGRPRVLPRQTEDPTHPSFEELVNGITRDVHPRPVLDELIRLRMVETVGSGEARVRLLQSAFVPVADSAQMLQLAHDNLADHCAAIAANLSGDGRRFLEQAIFSDGLTAESARRFNRETLAAWESAFATLMPRLRELYEADRQASEPRDHRVRLGMYGLAAPTRGNR